MAIIELKKPEVITCTSLWQQIATMSQIYEINDTQQDQLAQFLGHNIRDAPFDIWGGGGLDYF